MGYNSCPCSIFLNLKSQIGRFAFRDSKVKEDWTLECPEICTRQNVAEGMGLKMSFGDGRTLLKMGLKMPSKICLLKIRKMNVRMVSVSGTYLSCIWRLDSYEQKNGIRVWSVSKL